MRPALFWGSAVWLAFLLLLTNGQQISKEDKDKITKGLDAGKGLASALSDGNFGASLKNFGVRSSALLGTVGPLISFALSFIPTGGDSPLKALYNYMKQEFDIINRKLDSLPLRFEEVQKQIDWRSLQTSYGVYERNIRAADDCLNRFFRASREGRTAAKEIFLSKYKNGVAGSTQKLYDGVVYRKHILSQNIMSAVIQKTGCYKKKVESFSLGLTQLILQGINVEMAYYTFNGWPTTDLEREWASKLKIFCAALLQASQKCKTGYYRQMNIDVEKLIIDNSGQTPAQIQWTIYNFLVAKYDWRYWIVVVYKDISGYKKHTIHTCGGGFWLRKYGKNIVVASQSKSVRHFYRRLAQHAINSMHTYLASECSAERIHSNHARWLATFIKNRVGWTCNPYPLVLVVDGDEKLEFVSWTNRRFYYRFVNYACSRFAHIWDFKIVIFG